MGSLLPPSLEFPVRPSVRATGLTLALWACACALQVAWTLQVDDQGPLWGWLALGLASLVLFLQWLRPVRGRIVWDGAWHWQSKAYPLGTELGWPEVVLDFQQLMLLRLRNADGASWVVWVDAAAQRASWLDLRRALFSHSRPLAGVTDGPPASRTP